jgi:hypothetical protein
MEQLGSDFNATGSVMSKIQLEELRKKRGECVICGRKCFHKKLFKMIPISDHGRVLNGRCLQCHPLDVKDTDDGVMPAVSRQATEEDKMRFTRSQSKLNLGPDGRGGSMRRGASTMSILTPAPELSSVGSGAPRSMSLVMPSTSRGSSGNALSAQSSHTLSAQSSHTLSAQSSHTLSAQSTHTSNSRAPGGNSMDSVATGPPPPGMVSPPPPQGRTTSSNSSQNTDSLESSRRRASNGSQDMIASSRRASYGSQDLNNREASYGSQDLNIREASQQSRRMSHGSLDMREASLYPDQSQQRSPEDFEGAQPPPPVRQSIDHYRISGQTAMRSTSGSSFLSLMSTDSALTHDSPHEDYQGEGEDPEEYDDYTPLPLENRPSGEQLEDALERITGHNIDEEEAFALASAGAAAHPSAAALLEYYRRTFRESQRSLRSTNSREDSSHGGSHGEAFPEHGILNRGGVVSFSALARPPSSRRQYAGDRQPSGRSMNSRQASDQRQQSERSMNDGRQVMTANDRQVSAMSASSHQAGSQRSLNSRQNSRKQLQHAGSARSLGSVESFEDEHFDPGNTQERMNSHRSAHMPFNASDNHFSQYERDQGLDSSVPVDVSVGMRPMSHRAQFGRDDLDSSQHSAGDLGASIAMQSVDASLGMRPMTNRSQYGRDQGLDSSSHSQGGGGGMTNRSQYSDRSLLDAPQSHRMTIAQPTLEEQGLIRIKAAGVAQDEILNIMRDFPGSPPVQTTGLQELSNLHLSPQDSDMLAQFGAIQVIVEAMRSYPMDMELQICGSRAMWNISGTSGNQLAFVEAGALAVILNSMEGYLDVAEVQEQGLAALGNLGAVEANLQQIIEVGTVGRIVEAMNKHSDNAEVQMKGCTALTNLSSHDTPIKKSIMEAGGGGAVVISMVMHPSCPVLQEKALRALRNLSAQCEENKLELANIGGIDAVVTAMQVHRDIAGVQEAGAWALSNMAGNVDVKVLIGDCGGIDVIIRAMWVHSDCVSVEEWCCRALYTLSLDLHNSGMVLQVGGISAVVNAMQAHSDSSVVQEMGCAILCNLAVDQACKMRVVDEEALDAIVLAMVLHGESFKVQECACQVLLQLAIMENFKAMQASNIGELVRVAAETFPHNCDEPGRRLLHVLDGFAATYTG